MNFSVTLFRSDFKKNELFITMEEDQDKSFIDELNSVENDVETGENTFETEFDNLTFEPSNDIQEVDFLSEMLGKYTKLKELDLGKDALDNYVKLMMRMYYEKLIDVYHLIFNNYIRYYEYISVTSEDIESLEELVSSERIQHFKEKFRDSLYMQYKNLPNFENDDLVKESDEQLDDNQIDGLKKAIMRDRLVMKMRMSTLPDRFLTALFFNYILGIGVLPYGLLKYVEQFVYDREMPFSSNDEYINSVLFYGFYKVQPIPIPVKPQSVNKIIDILDTNEDILNDFSLKCVVMLVKGRFSYRSIERRQMLERLFDLVLELFSKIPEHNVILQKMDEDIAQENKGDLQTFNFCLRNKENEENMEEKKPRVRYSRKQQVSILRVLKSLNNKFSDNDIKDIVQGEPYIGLTKEIGDKQMRFTQIRKKSEKEDEPKLG